MAVKKTTQKLIQTLRNLYLQLPFILLTTLLWLAFSILLLLFITEKFKEWLQQPALSNITNQLIGDSDANAKLQQFSFEVLALAGTCFAIQLTLVWTHFLMPLKSIRRTSKELIKLQSSQLLPNIEKLFSKNFASSSTEELHKVFWDHASHLVLNQILHQVQNFFDSKKNTFEILDNVSALQMLVNSIETILPDSFPKFLVLENGGYAPIVKALIRGKIEITKDDQELLERRAKDALMSSKSGIWFNKSYFVKKEIPNSLGGVIVLNLTQSTQTPLRKRDWESLSLAWIGQSLKIAAQIRNELSEFSIKLNTELKRYHMENTLASGQVTSKIQHLSAHKLQSGDKPKGDFICVFKSEKKSSSFVIMGKVAGEGMRSSFIASNIVAILIERNHTLSEKPPHELLEALAEAVNRYLFRAFDGKLSASLQAFSFNHDTGNGYYVSFGQPLPLVISPNERKPMVVVPATQEGFLGLQELSHVEVTQFSILPGQVFFASSGGILSAQDPSGKRFEKNVHRGAMQDMLFQKQFLSAHEMLESIFAATSRHRGDLPQSDDYTGVILMAVNPYLLDSLGTAKG